MPFSIRDITPEQAAALSEQLRRHKRFYVRLVARLHKWIPGIDADSYAMMCRAMEAQRVINDMQGIASRAGKGREWVDDPAAWRGWGI